MANKGRRALPPLSRGKQAREQGKQNPKPPLVRTRHRVSHRASRTGLCESVNFELSKTTLFSLILQQLQFPAPNPSQRYLKFEPRTRTWGLTTERIPKWNRRGQPNEYKTELFGLFSVLLPWFKI